LRRQADFSRLAEVPALAVAGAHEKEGVTERKEREKKKKRMRTEFRLAAISAGASRCS
jgi:hypothetical protein